MAIKSTAQMIHLTCDKCQTIQDRIPVMPGVWDAIVQAGWSIDREAKTCVCPDCIHAQVAQGSDQ